MRLGLVRQVFGGVLALLLPRFALAESPRTLSLIYSAPDGCPSEQAFVQRVRARTQAPGVGDAGTRTLRVQITVVGARHVGRLSLVEGGGRSTTKTLNANNCEELVDALSLVAALAMDSDERAATAETGEVRQTPSPAVPVREPDAAPQPAPLRADPVESRLGVGLGAFVAAGVAPSVLVGGTLNLDWAFLGARAFAPAFAVELAAAQSLDEVTAGGTASFTWLTVRANACLLRIALGPSVRLRGCLLGNFGLLRARGRNTIDPATSSRGWLSLGGASGLEVPVGPRLALHGLVSVEAPLRRDGYAFAANQFFAVPVVIVTASVAMLSYFP